MRRHCSAVGRNRQNYRRSSKPQTINNHPQMIYILHSHTSKSSSSSCSSSNIIRSSGTGSLQTQPPLQSFFSHWFWTRKCGNIISLSSFVLFLAYSSRSAVKPRPSKSSVCISVLSAGFYIFNLATLTFPSFMLTVYSSSLKYPVYLLTVEIQLH